MVVVDGALPPRALCRFLRRSGRCARAQEPLGFNLFSNLLLQEALEKKRG